MTVKFIADAVENCSDFENIAVSSKEISIDNKDSKKLDPSEEEKTIPNSVCVRYPGKMSYKERLNESFRRVYGCNHSNKEKKPEKLKREINKSIMKPSSNMNGDIDNLILIAVEYLRFPPYVADRTKLIMARMWSYPDNFHDLKYENVVLGILMYVVYENFSEDATVDFRGYCTLLFGEAQAERNIRQMYQACEIVKYMYREVEEFRRH